MLSGSIALECMEAIARRNPQTLDLVGRVERRELPKCSALDFRWQPSRTAGGPEPLCLPVRERSDHDLSVTRHVMRVKKPCARLSGGTRFLRAANDESQTPTRAGRLSQMPAIWASRSQMPGVCGVRCPGARLPPICSTGKVLTVNQNAVRPSPELARQSYDGIVAPHHREVIGKRDSDARANPPSSGAPRRDAGRCRC